MTRMVDTSTCNKCGQQVSARTFNAAEAAIDDHAQWAHGEFLGAVWRSKPVTVAVKA